jgi:hypothetical protein
MNLPHLEKLARWLALGAGALDAGTGTGLVVAPVFTLGLMQAGTIAPEAETYLRFTGVFVGMVGFSYLWALRRGPATLRTVFALTAWFRLAVGIFSTWAIATGRLGMAWVSVPATDFFLAATQAWLLRQGVFRDAR